MSYAKRIDNNQNKIVDALRKMGVSVFITSGIGRGFGDLICGINGLNLIFEIKDGNKFPSARKLTEIERKFHAEWKGQICIIESEEEAINFIKNLIGNTYNVV